MSSRMGSGSKTTGALSGGEVLLSTVDTPEIDARIMAAAAVRFPEAVKLSTNFEHGHWWLTVDRGTEGNEAHNGEDVDSNYDVVDAEGGQSIDGFDFEQV